MPQRIFCATAAVEFFNCLMTSVTLICTKNVKHSSKEAIFLRDER